MTKIAKHCAELLYDCEQLLISAGQEAFTAKHDLLNGSSIGMHFRHVLEFLFLLDEGSDQVNYDERKRDLVLENELQAAISASSHFREKLSSNNYQNRNLNLVWTYDEETETVPSSFRRELAYNLEHIVHHMALIRIGVQLSRPDLKIPDDFGLANSTKRFRSQQA